MPPAIVQLLFLNALLVGAGILLLIFIRALPRLDESAPPRRGVVERWLTSRLPERMDAFARAAVLRALRRLKVLVLRIDNGINRKLQRMKLESGESMGPPKIDLKKVVGIEAKKEKAVIGPTKPKD